MKSEKRIPFFLIWKYLQRCNKWTLGLIILFMSIAFINMVFITSLFNGIIEGFNQQIIDTSTGNILALPPEGDDVLIDVDHTLESIQQVDGVVAASARSILPASLEYENQKGSWQILVINPDVERAATVVADRMTDGSYLTTDDTNGIILGESILGGAESDGDNPFALNGVDVGDTVTLQFGTAQYDFVVRGFFFTKFVDTDSSAFITQAAYERINPVAEDTATSIIIRIEKTGDERMMIDRLAADSIPTRFYSWEDASDLMDSVSDSFVSINVILTAVGILIAAITIFIIIYIDISNKRKQIGILRAIGIKPYLINAMYILQTVVYSMSGILVGSLIFFFAIIPYFNAHPFVLPIADATLHVNYAEFIARFEILICISIISGLIPAMYITRMKILDAIWGK